MGLIFCCNIGEDISRNEVYLLENNPAGMCTALIWPVVVMLWEILLHSGLWPEVNLAKVPWLCWCDCGLKGHGHSLEWAKLETFTVAATFK